MQSRSPILVCMIVYGTDRNQYNKKAGVVEIRRGVLDEPVREVFSWYGVRRSCMHLVWRSFMQRKGLGLNRNIHDSSAGMMLLFINMADEEQHTSKRAKTSGAKVASKVYVS